MANEKECLKSPDGNHQWVYPRLEDSIDKNRDPNFPYCKYCFEKDSSNDKPEGGGWFESRENSHIGRH